MKSLDHPQTTVPMFALSVLPLSLLHYSFLFLLPGADGAHQVLFKQIDRNAVVSDACASYSTLDRLNRHIKPSLDSITQETDFFAYYRLNLFNKECPFVSLSDSTSMCGNIACAVNTLENEDDIPMIWRAESLQKIEGPKVGHPGNREEREKKKPLHGMLGEDVGESCVVEYDDEADERDYCVPEEESAASKGDYVSLVDNPERYTGYSGEGAHHVWEAIYKENCFSSASFPHSADSGMSAPMNALLGQASMDLKSVMKESSPEDFPDGNDEQCLEKRVFYRVISGMHASISTHICHEYLNTTTGVWSPNLSCYLERLHSHPERVSNLYFNYALLVRAVAKLGPYLQRHTFCPCDPAQDDQTKEKVYALTSQAASVPQIFDESLMFVNGEGPSLKEDFRNRFRNVSRLMDCVGCDKCRLWGKLQTAGYGTALKVLFEFNGDEVEGNEPVLKRTELVALMNTLARVSASIAAIQDFRAAVKHDHNPPNSSSSTSPPIPLTPRITNAHNVHPPSPEPFNEETPDSSSSRNNKYLEELTVYEQICEEIGLVYRTFKYVLWSYTQIPGNLWRVFKIEAGRAFDGFIGLPVRPRRWRLEKPSLEHMAEWERGAGAGAGGGEKREEL